VFCHRDPMAHILIVDDDDAFRESLAETLADLGHRITESGTGREALALLEGLQRFDCVFLDFRLPDMNGIEVLERLRAIPAHKALSVVILTAFATSDNTIHAMRLGAFEHLTKPVGRDSIVALMDRIGASGGPQDARPEAGVKPAEPVDSVPRLIGKSESLREIQKQIGRAAASDSTVSSRAKPAPARKWP